MDCSIIICTRGRGERLQKTLCAFALVRVPAEWEVEMIVADNDEVGSAAEVVRMTKLDRISIHYLHERVPGKSRALNAAVAKACGRVLLFTDDDVEPAESWLERMAEPLLEGRCAAVAGRIELAPHLVRSWFGAMHRTWLAEILDPGDGKIALVGASMGVHGSVFELIGGFDEALGPGASGFGEETLLGMQIEEAGLLISPVVGTFVVHYPDVSRLLRADWVLAAARFGETSAYIMYHWEHAAVVFPRIRAVVVSAKLGFRRWLMMTFRGPLEGCSAWEMSYRVQIARLRKIAAESNLPRNYCFRSLHKNRFN
ncbi:MAG: glycosyltransferase family A protein [Akkermansiaceae bacterium]|nr:glycosyltransferase family A protein [Akkermansiaceae bacterium]